MRKKITFKSGDNTLSGLLESPQSHTRFYALFAHCFTCTKNIAAASRISRALTAKGIAVLRFDFTGLGNSDGDFANTNFSSNIQDLVAAADFLRTHYEAPKLLIGHSLGGAAALRVALEVPESLAVVTIAAPFNAAHVARNFSAQINDIEQEGQAQVSLGGRKFTIKKQFLDDINYHDSSYISDLNKAILILHSPADTVVNIHEAEKIYQTAQHPKSFVSLDNADHLLSNKDDSAYVGDIVSAWASRYIPSSVAIYNKDVLQGHVLVEEKDHRFTQHVSTNSHYWLADEPTHVGGKNTGPDPYEHLLAGLGACTSMTLRMYADRKKWPVTNIKVELSHTRNYQDDCDNCDAQTGIEAIVRNISIEGDVDDEQKARLLDIADKCPVHKTMHNNVMVVSKLTT